MATHSSILAREILWTEEPGGLQSIASQRVRHNIAADTNTTNLTGPRVTECLFVSSGPLGEGRGDFGGVQGGC